MSGGKLLILEESRYCMPKRWAMAMSYGQWGWERQERERPTFQGRTQYRLQRAPFPIHQWLWSRDQQRDRTRRRPRVQASGSEIRQVRRSLWAGQWAQLTVPGSISSSSQSSMVPSILINFGSDGSVMIRSMVSGPKGFFMHGRIVAHP